MRGVVEIIIVNKQMTWRPITSRLVYTHKRKERKTPCETVKQIHQFHQSLCVERYGHISVVLDNE
jgi:hypothetical protein